MTRPSPRIRLRIDRITIDRPGLDGNVLEAALHREISRLVADHGIAAFGSGARRDHAQAEVATGSGPLAERVASATVKAATP